MSEKLLSETVNRYNTYEMNGELDGFSPKLKSVRGRSLVSANWLILNR